MNNHIHSQADAIGKIVSGKKILFATVPADGHVNPLTGLAVHLQKLGYDVRWYTSQSYSEKLARLKISLYPFVKALDVRGANDTDVFPERKKYKSQIAKLNFDLIHTFTLRAEEYYQDIRDIYRSFPFDCMIADCAFGAIPFVKEKMNVPVIGIGVLPLTSTSKDLPPAGLGILPSYSSVGRIKQGALRWIADHIIFKKANKVLARLCDKYQIDYDGSNIFNFIINHSTLFLQTGTPGFEYRRSDLAKHIKFLGPLLPHATDDLTCQWYDERLCRYERVVIVTQGTVEKDTEKLIVPTLKAFKDTNLLVVVTTGGSNTADLRARFPFDNIIIEDFIPFADIMPYADAFITNGGHGGVQMAIKNEIPLAVAGMHEGKNEINARVEYFKLGINMRTEKPTPSQVRKAVVEVLNNVKFRNNVKRLAKAFNSYNPNDLCASYVKEVLQNKRSYTSPHQRRIVLY